MAVVLVAVVVMVVVVVVRIFKSAMRFFAPFQQESREAFIQLTRL